MDSRTPERPSADATEFVRFCYRRRRVGWPELYDEMCAVANRGLYRGWGTDELGTAGIGFTLFEMPALAALVGRVVSEEHERRLLARAAVAEAARSERAANASGPPAALDPPGERAADHPSEPAIALRYATASAGA
ncbi:MAG TPA: hypothetical protein VM344_06165 [Vitreimonas sp.]|nr:hypothetical protein [Vitreimonas sp.]